MITVTSGHGDFRQPFEVPRVLGAPQSRGKVPMEFAVEAQKLLGVSLEGSVG